MQTVEAFLDKNKVTFEDNFFAPKKRTKILVTFIEESDDLLELDKNEVSTSLLEGKKRVLKKDKSLFTNI